MHSPVSFGQSLVFQEEFQAYVKLKELFSPEMTRFTIVVFNGMDELGDTIGIHLTLMAVILITSFFAFIWYR